MKKLSRVTAVIGGAPAFAGVMALSILIDVPDISKAVLLSILALHIIGIALLFISFIAGSKCGIKWITIIIKPDYESCELIDKRIGRYLRDGLILADCTFFGIRIFGIESLYDITVVYGLIWLHRILTNKTH